MNQPNNMDKHSDQSIMDKSMRSVFGKNLEYRLPADYDVDSKS